MWGVPDPFAGGRAPAGFLREGSPSAAGPGKTGRGGWSPPLPDFVRLKAGQEPPPWWPAYFGNPMYFGGSGPGDPGPVGEALRASSVPEVLEGP